MADIELVIKISEDDYEKMKWTSVKNGAKEELDYMRGLILSGTPLPKGHGALIDRSEVIKNLLDYKKGKKTLGQCIEDVQTIIEVDWEDEEE